MGYVVAVSPCLNCKRVFSYNPVKVPSIRIPPITGPREPLCETCFEQLNHVRRARGLEPWSPPLPGAYEPCDESELPLE